MTRAARRPRTATRPAAPPQPPPPEPPPDRAARAAAGRRLRQLVPRSSHAELPPPRPGRDAVRLLVEQGATRVPELLPLRYGRMAVSPFTFYRGAARVMADDLAATPRTGLQVQACGDAHLSNFGLFASPERRLVFDINDFDETLPGPWEWDVKRLATSIEVAARENGHSDKQCRNGVLAAVEGYRLGMRDLAEHSTLDVWYAHLSSDELSELFSAELSRARRRQLDKAFAKARTRDNLGALHRFVEQLAGFPRIAADPPIVVPLAGIVEPGTDVELVGAGLRSLLAQYRETLEPERRVLFDRFTLVDMARKVVGVGSVGTRCWMLLLFGDDADDPLFLQAKEAGPSVLEDYLEPSEFANAGQRVVVGQRLMQTVSDIFLGWVRVESTDSVDGGTRDFYVRQLRDWKGSADVEALRPAGMRAYARLCGWTLARAHARSGDRIAIASYLGSTAAFDEAVGEFARAYADRNAGDHHDLVQAVTDGTLAAETG